MERTLVVTEAIPVPAERAWAAIAGVGGLDRWFPVISACQVEGEGIGARRVMELVEGGRITDLIIELEPERRRLRYDRVSSPLPVDRYLGTVQVDGTGPESCRVSWSVDLEVAPEAADGVVAFLEQAIGAGVSGLARELTAAA